MVSSIREFIRRFGLLHEHYEPFSVFSKKKNVSTNKKCSAEQKNFRKIIQNLRKNLPIKKSSAKQKNLRPKIYLFVKYLRIFAKNENLRNEDSEILFAMKTIVCQFHETRTFVFFRIPSMWPQPFFNIAHVTCFEVYFNRMLNGL